MLLEVKDSYNKENFNPNIQQTFLKNSNIQGLGIKILRSQGPQKGERTTFGGNPTLVESQNMDSEGTTINSNSEIFSILSQNFQNSELSSFENSKIPKEKSNIFRHENKSIQPQISDLDSEDGNDESMCQEFENPKKISQKLDHCSLSQMMSFGIDKQNIKEKPYIPDRQYDHTQFDRPYLPKIITKVNYQKQKMGIFSNGKMHPSLFTDSAETLEVRNQSSQMQLSRFRVFRESRTRDIELLLTKKNEKEILEDSFEEIKRKYNLNLSEEEKEPKTIEMIEKFLEEECPKPAELWIADAIIYRGGLKDGLFDGFGEVLTASGLQIYSGSFKEGKLHGTGILHNIFHFEEFQSRKLPRELHFLQIDNGPLYYALDESNGGVLNLHCTLKNWEYYKGEFFNGVRQGSGELKLLDGKLFRGSFYAGKAAGDGFLTTGRKIIMGYWEDNKLLKFNN